MPAALPDLGALPTSAFSIWCWVGFFYCFLFLFVFALFVSASSAGSRVLVFAGLWTDFPALGSCPRSPAATLHLRVRPTYALLGSLLPVAPYLCWVCRRWWALTLACLGYCLLSPWPPPSMSCCPSGQASAYSAPYFFCPKKPPQS